MNFSPAYYISYLLNYPEYLSPGKVKEAIDARFRRFVEEEKHKIAPSGNISRKIIREEYKGNLFDLRG